MRETNPVGSQADRRSTLSRACLLLSLAVLAAIIVAAYSHPLNDKPLYEHPDDKEFSVQQHDGGRCIKNIKLPPDDELTRRFRDWLTAAPQEDGWQGTLANYAPSLVVACEHANVNFTGKSVVLNSDLSGRQRQQIRKCQPADEAMRAWIQERLARESQSAE